MAGPSHIVEVFSGGKIVRRKEYVENKQYERIHKAGAPNDSN